MAVAIDFADSKGERQSQMSPRPNVEITRIDNVGNVADDSTYLWYSIVSDAIDEWCKRL